jgi:hypothetical protein
MSADVRRPDAVGMRKMLQGSVFLLVETAGFSS